jgi:hypothetical protein
MLPARALLALAALPLAWTRGPLRPPALPASPADECGGHLCSGFAWYPVAAGGQPTAFSARFNVPALPADIRVDDPDFCHYIYFNIFFPNGAPAGAVYNQFVPQLVLGNALTGSSGPPRYSPSWGNYSTWYFSAQYFFALNATAGSPPPSYHAATGAVFPVAAGEVLWTRMDFDPRAASWRLSMGVEGDEARTSAVDAPRPFMGLLDAAASWADPAYSLVHVNSCWELYGLTSPGAWPSSGSSYAMQVGAAQPGAFPWRTDWSNGSELDCPGQPTNVTWREAHNDTAQLIEWDVQWGRG